MAEALRTLPLAARIARQCLFIAGLAWAACLYAAQDAKALSAGGHLSDQASLRRGARLFMEYCSGCHGLKYLRYSHLAQDLGMSEHQVMDTLDFTGVPLGQTVQTALPPSQAQKWFGTVPPDLSLIARVRGADWIHTYLKSFYLDQSRPFGWNNALLPDTSMPNPLWDLQGLQQARNGAGSQLTTGKPVLALVAQGRQTQAQFDQSVRDIANFLQYAGEPAALKRRSIGVPVVAFLAAFTFLAWLLKIEYWKDVR